MQRLQEFFLVLNILILFTLTVWAFDLDLRISQYFFQPPATIPDAKPWLGQRLHSVAFIYHSAKIPALTLALLSIAVLIVGRRQQQWRLWRRQAIFIVLFLLTGPWLLVNVALKDGLGKASPSELRTFGGAYAYAQFWEPGTGKKNGAFHSGHAAIAFSLMAPYFFLRQQHRQWAQRFLFSGLAWGLIVGMARVAQGGHFFSDVIWSGFISYLLGILLAALFRFDQAPSPGQLLALPGLDHSFIFLFLHGKKARRVAEAEDFRQPLGIH